MLHCVGMAELGWLPVVLTKRTGSSDAPLFAILVCVFFVLTCVHIPYLRIVSFVNTSYAFSMLQEFAAFLYLRKEHKNLHRPFQIPFIHKDDILAAIFLIMPAASTCLILIFSPIIFLECSTFFSTLTVLLIGLFVEYLLKKWRDDGTLKFSRRPPEALPLNMRVEESHKLIVLKPPI